MTTPVALFSAVASLIILLAASELMVGKLENVAQRLGLGSEALGFIVAVGADAPEISTAVVALAAGSQRIGLGVVEGSNIYNLAGLLGLSALLAGPLVISRRAAWRDGGMNLVLTTLTVLLILIPPVRASLAAIVLLVLGCAVALIVRGGGHARERGRLGWPIVLATIAALTLVGMSVVLVRSAIVLIHLWHIHQTVVGILVLPVATSVPNTWAALSLARRGLADAVVATTFASNSINLALGVALPSLIVGLHPDAAARAFDGPWLAGMTTVALLICLRRPARREGAVVGLLYLTFIVLRLTFFG